MTTLDPVALRTAALTGAAAVTAAGSNPAAIGRATAQAFGGIGASVQVAPGLITNLKLAVSPDGTVTITFPPVPNSQGNDIWCNGTDDAHKISYQQFPLGATVVTIVDKQRLSPANPSASYYGAAYNNQGDGPIVGPFVASYVAPGPTPTPPGPTPTPAAGELGIFTWSQLPDLEKTYETQLGRVFDGVLVHTDMTNWSTLQNVWFGSAWKGTTKQMVITVCPFPNDGSTMAKAAAGAYDTQWRTLLQGIAALFPNAWLRWAHEQNCCYPWRANQDLPSYLAMTQRWYGLARSISAGFKLIWNPIYGDGVIPAEQTYPTGSQKPDKLGLDVYDYSVNGVPQDATILTGSHGLNWLSTFAASKGLPCCLPECGVATYPSNPSQNGGDDPTFPSMVAQWAASCGADVTWYCDDNSGVHSDLLDGSFPNAQAMWKRIYARAAVAQLVTPRLMIVQHEVKQGAGAQAARALQAAKLAA